MFASKNLRVSFIFIFIGLVSFYFSDLEITTLDATSLSQDFFLSIFSMEYNDYSLLLVAFLRTITIAILAIFFSIIFGAILSLFFTSLIVRISLAFTRSIHELFWALIFLQIFGLNTLTALLAIVIPYSATLAKVYAEILQEHDTFTDTLRGKDRLSYYIYTKIPDALPHLISYTRYRFECALRSTAILGFVGITTLGYYLSSSFMQGLYHEVWLILVLFYILIASIKQWFNKYTFIPLVVASFLYLDDFSGFNLANLKRFFTQDIIPYPIKNDLGLQSSISWFENIFTNEILPGATNTLVLTQLSLLLTALLTLLLFPLVSSKFVNKPTKISAHILLVVLRSTPEYILAYIFLQLFGPSMLPAVLALMLHNGSIISHLIGHGTDALKLRIDSTKRKSELYFYEVAPRVYAQFLAFLFYRWEIIMRESAILGVLGITTLGFYIDSAIEDFRLDKMFLLLLITAFLNIIVDVISKKVREYLRASKYISTCQPLKQ
ncbi:MAG: phosphonate transport system permease protein [Sulfurimonas sp.]|jgi:phosphonate transport system permease protein